MRNYKCSLSDELVLNVGVVLAGVHFSGNLFLARLHFGPAINFKTDVLLNYVCVCIPNRDSVSLLYDVQLLVESHHLDAAKLISNDALSESVHVAAIVSLTLTNDLNRENSQVHVDSRAGLKLVHSGKHRFGFDDWLEVFLGGLHHYLFKY